MRLLLLALLLGAQDVPARPEAEAYMMQAIALARANHVNSAGADWDRITADARAAIGGAQAPRDTYKAIRGMLAALGERHSFFRPPLTEPFTPNHAATPPATPRRPLPTAKLIDGRFAIVALPMLDTMDAAGRAHGERYRATLHAALQALDRQPICGWIVDLRGNGGGNMWPMLQGLDPLLGEGPFGSFVDPRGGLQFWRRLHGGVGIAASAQGDAAPSFDLVHRYSPVAVLIGPQTASSGEMAAIALIGRHGVRTFGAASAGYTTANRVFTMPDGAMLVLTTAFVRNRTGKAYRGPLIPDQPSDGDSAQAAATAWLRGNCQR